MKVLVTGGAGFIGSHLVEALSKQEHDVTVLDNFSTGSMLNLRSIKVKIVSGDVAKYEFLPQEKFDVIYHLAAEPWSIANTLGKRKRIFMTNTYGTLNMLNIPNDLFVFTSTANLYGNGRKFKETDKMNIPSFYGFTKAIAEEIIRFSRKPYVIFRPGTVIGSRGRCFPNRLVWCAVNNKPVEIFNNGDTRRDIINVRDVVSALIIAPELENGIFNLGSNSEIVGHQLGNFVTAIAEKREYRFSFDLTPSYPAGYVLESTLDSDLLIKTGLWHPKHKLEQTLKSLFKYYEQEESIEPPSYESL